MKFGVKYLFLFIVLLSASCLHYGDKREADIGKIKINDEKLQGTSRLCSILTNPT